MANRAIAGGLVAVGALILGVSSVPSAGGPGDKRPANGLPRAVFHTSQGDIGVTLRPDQAPMTVECFIRNCGAGVYTGVCFDEAAGNLVFAGSRMSDGRFNSAATAARVPERREVAENHRVERGQVGLRPVAVRGGAADSFELYFATGSCPAGDGRLNVFGEITGGIEILDELVAHASEDGTPAKTVVIESVSIER